MATQQQEHEQHPGKKKPTKPTTFEMGTTGDISIDECSLQVLLPLASRTTFLEVNKSCLK